VCYRFRIGAGKRETKTKKGARSSNTSLVQNLIMRKNGTESSTDPTYAVCVARSRWGLLTIAPVDGPESSPDAPQILKLFVLFINLILRTVHIFGQVAGPLCTGYILAVALYLISIWFVHLSFHHAAFASQFISY
jgi:hypothetical protein